MKKTTIVCVFLILLGIMGVSATELDIQGKATNKTTGLAITGNLSINVTYTSPDASAILYSEAGTTAATKGMWNYIIGRTTPITPYDWYYFYSQYGGYNLSVKIGNNTLSSVPVTFAPLSHLALIANNSFYLGNQSYTYYTTDAEFNSLVNLSMQQINDSQGNWSGDKPNYLPYNGANQNLNIGVLNVTIDDSLFVDSTNNRVGINTVLPNESVTIKKNMAFDKVWAWIHTTTPAYTNYTYEASTTRGTVTGDLLDHGGATHTQADTDFIYLAKSTPFSAIYWDIGTAKSATGSLIFEYSTAGSTWNNITTMVDNTVGLTLDGDMLFDAPSNWSMESVNGSVPYYWVRISSTTTAYTAEPTAFLIIPSINQKSIGIYGNAGDNTGYVIDANGLATITNVNTITTLGAGTFVGVAVGGALSTASTGAFSGAITETQQLLFVSTDGIVSTATTAATLAIPQHMSPRLRFSGNAWGTTLGTSQTVNWKNEVIPISSDDVTSKLIWAHGLNDVTDLGFDQLMSLGSIGTLDVFGLEDGAEVLSNGNFTGNTSWIKNGGWDIGVSTANMSRYQFSGGANGNLTQDMANFTTPLKPNRWYTLSYNVSGTGVAGCLAYVSTEISTETVYLPGVTLTTMGGYDVNIKTNSNPGNFTITARCTAGSFYIDTLSLKEKIGGNIIANGLFTGGGTTGIKIDGEGLVGINTITPRGILDVNGSVYINITNCTQALETDADGMIICGTDATGGGGSYTPDNASLINSGGLDQVNGSWVKALLSGSDDINYNSATGQIDYNGSSASGSGNCSAEGSCGLITYDTELDNSSILRTYSFNETAKNSGFNFTSELKAYFDSLYYELTDKVGNTTPEIQGVITKAFLEGQGAFTSEANLTALLNDNYQGIAGAYTLTNFTANYEARTDRYGNANFTAQYDAITSRFGETNYTALHTEANHWGIGVLSNDNSSFIRGLFSGSSNLSYDSATGTFAINISFSSSSGSGNCSAEGSCGLITYDTELDNSSILRTYSFNETAKNSGFNFTAELKNYFDSLYYELTDKVGNTTAEIQGVITTAFIEGKGFFDSEANLTALLDNNYAPTGNYLTNQSSANLTELAIGGFRIYEEAGSLIIG